MQQLPPIVLECPECGEKYLISRESFTPSEKAILFSDGFFCDEINWRTPFIIGCVTCELGFFPHKGKIIAEPQWEEFNNKWSQIKKAEPPTAGALALELRIKRNMSLADELDLRKEFWYSGQHTETGRLLMSKNPKFKQFWTNSLIQLESLLSPIHNNDQIIKAEINRQLGNFDKCMELLVSAENSVAKQIFEYAQTKNSLLFKIASF